MRLKTRTIEILAKEQGLNQTQLADKLGMKKQNLNRLLRGRRQNFTVETVERLCAQLQCGAGDILEYVTPEQIQLEEAAAAA